MTREEMHDKLSKVMDSVPYVKWHEAHDKFDKLFDELDSELTYELQNNLELAYELSQLKNRACKDCVHLNSSGDYCGWLDLSINADEYERFYCADWEKEE